MSWLARFRAWRKERREFNHRRWLRRNKVILPKPADDDRSSIVIHRRMMTE